MTDRIQYSPFHARVMSADEAAAFIQPGETVAMSGFTGSGYPKVCLLYTSPSPRD